MPIRPRSIPTRITIRIRITCRCEKPRSRKGAIAIAAVIGAVVLGGGGAYLASGSAAITGGEPPLIKANNEPTKVQPQNPGGVEIPNQNKQIYERANQSGATKVVNREEQPVDVQQAVRMNGNAVADATGGTVPGVSVKPQQTASLNLGEPRKVRTVTIRPDGTVAGAEPPAAQPVATASAGGDDPAAAGAGRPSGSGRVGTAPRCGEHARRGGVHPGFDPEAGSCGRDACQRACTAAGGLRAAGRTCRSRDDLDRRLRRAAGSGQFGSRRPDGLRLVSAQVSRPAGQAGDDPQGRGERQHHLPRPRRAAAEGGGLVPLLQAAGAGRSVLRHQELIA